MCLLWVHCSKHVVNPESNSTTRSLTEKKNINFVKFQDSSYVSIDKLKMASKKNNDYLKQGHPFPYREPRDSLPLRTFIQKQKPLISFFLFFLIKSLVYLFCSLPFIHWHQLAFNDYYKKNFMSVIILSSLKHYFTMIIYLI